MVNKTFSSAPKIKVHVMFKRNRNRNIPLINVEPVTSTTSLTLISSAFHIAFRSRGKNTWFIDDITAIALSTILNTKILISCACRLTCLDGWVNYLKEDGITKCFVAFCSCSLGVATESHA